LKSLAIIINIFFIYYALNVPLIFPSFLIYKAVDVCSIVQPLPKLIEGICAELILPLYSTSLLLYLNEFPTRVTGDAADPIVALLDKPIFPVIIPPDNGKNSL